jgi:diaminohydroxyphosphoribosylaminopyrimidine deaminase/5-amino-6-(5-phosphoribosylamino)uracil reductase
MTAGDYRQHDERRYMARAIALAWRGLGTTEPNPRVGCVIVRDGAVVGEGWHVRAGEPHAEVHALRAAGGLARGATAYVSLEPCCHQGRTPPCTGALVAAGIARVVYGCGDPNPRVAGGGAAQLRAAGIAVEGGMLEAEARAVNPGFLARMARGRPWLRVKTAASIDGRTALADGRSRWITGADARRDVQRLRARSSAIVTGIGTVLADDPELTVRDEPAGALRPPVRVVLDSSLRMPPTARLLARPGGVVVLATRDDPARHGPLAAAGADVRIVAGEAGRVAPASLLDVLVALECNEVLVEAGPVVNGALLAAGLVDELVVYQAAHVLGDTARGMFALPPLASMDARPAFRLADVRRVGDDLRLTYLAKEN